MAEAVGVTRFDEDDHGGADSTGRPERDATVAADIARHEMTLVVENMHCGGCIRTVEQTLSAMLGVVSARANLSTRRVTLVTDKALKSELPFVEALAGKGFKSARLADMLPDDERMAKAEADLLRRLGVAGFAAANVMLLSIAVWSGQYGEMPKSLVSLFHWLSAMITLPAVAYAGQPFFSSARSALSAGRLNMDVPISLGVLLATGLSLYDTASGNEHAYFDAAITLL
ncbi:MAG: cation transporter, partial [Hyphomicrobiaceae bacterium]